VSKATEIASKQLSSKIQKPPSTATGLETDFNSLKKDPAALYAYLINIGETCISQIFKGTEL